MTYYEFNGFKISYDEVSNRLFTGHLQPIPVNDILIGDNEWEFTGNAYNNGIAYSEDKKYFLIFPTIEKYKKSKRLQNKVLLSTGSEERANDPDYHDLCMCFGILFEKTDKYHFKLVNINNL